MLIFGKRTDSDFHIPAAKALDASLSQARELLSNLVDDGESYIGLKDDECTIKFTAVKNYLFFIEVPLEEKFGAKEAYFSRTKTYNLLVELFEGKKINDISGLVFKSYL